MLKIVRSILSLILVVSVLTSCQSKTSSQDNLLVVNESPIEWSRNANIYEVNIRQYSKEGTINAFVNHLPRLKQMGVDILWLMPVYPISEKNRKGSKGSFYSVRDYRSVNPEFGTMEDLKNLVKKAHEMGMYVILDWVANHTGWDNAIMEKNPEWYTQNEKGEIVVPEGTDWTDTADLNYENEELREYMIESLKFWVENADVDGFRCDVAGMVPVDFWVEARKQLDAVKPVFMLAEAWEPELVEEAFDMCYGWDFFHLMNSIAEGEKTAEDIDSYFARIDTTYNEDAYIMNFITNHDENTWNGTVYERMGEGASTFAVLTFTIPGMPLIYSGQEAGLNKRLKLFEKDEIDWENKELIPFYTKLISLKKSNKALRNGVQGGELVRIPSNNDEAVYAFVREKEGDKVLVILNLTGEEVTTDLKSEALAGSYINFFTQGRVNLKSVENVSLKPWEYRVLVK